MFKKFKPGCLMLNSGHFATPFSSQRHISFDRFFILKKGRRGVWMETRKFQTRQDGLELRLWEEKEYIFKEWSALYGRVDFKKEGYGSRKVFYFLLLYFVFHETLLRDFSSWKASDCDLRTVISPTCDGGGIVLWVCLCVCVQYALVCLSECYSFTCMPYSKPRPIREVRQVDSKAVVWWIFQLFEFNLFQYA